MPRFSIGLALGLLSLLVLQGCASNDVKSGQAASASVGNADQEFVTGSRIPRKAPRPSENVVVKDASGSTGL